MTDKPFKMTDAECAEQLMNRLAREIVVHMRDGNEGEARQLMPVCHWLEYVIGYVIEEDAR